MHCTLYSYIIVFSSKFLFARGIGVLFTAGTHTKKHAPTCTTLYSGINQHGDIACWIDINKECVSFFCVFHNRSVGANVTKVKLRRLQLFFRRDIISRTTQKKTTKSPVHSSRCCKYHSSCVYFTRLHKQINIKSQITRLQQIMSTTLTISSVFSLLNSTKNEFSRTFIVKIDTFVIICWILLKHLTGMKLNSFLVQIWNKFFFRSHCNISGSIGEIVIIELRCA